MIRLGKNGGNSWIEGLVKPTEAYEEIRPILIQIILTGIL